MTTVSSPLERAGSPPANLPRGPRFARPLWSDLRVFTGGVAILVVVASAAVAGTLAASGAPVYGGRAELLYRPGDSRSTADAERQLATQSVLLQSRVVLQPVAEAEGLQVEDLERAVEVEAVQRSEVLRLTIADADADRARRVAELVVERYLTVTAPGEGLLAARRVELEERLATIRVAQDDRFARLAQFDASTEETGEEAPLEASLLEEQFREGERETTDLRDHLVQMELEEALAAQAAPTAEVLTPAYVLEDPLEPRPLQAAAAGGLIGFLVAAALAAALLRVGPR